MQYLYKFVAVGLVAAFFVGAVFGSATRYRWRKGPIAISVSTSIVTNTANIAAGTDVAAVIDRSIGVWNQAAAVSLRRNASPEQSVSPSSQGDGISILTIAATPENLALFPAGLDDAAARTRIFYDARGYITEADVVLNPYLQFSTDGTLGTFDLESTVTHELGHVLGLEHSPVVASTMNDSYGKNGVYNLPAFSARTLASDDVASVRSLYGTTAGVDECCGRITGRIFFAVNKPAAGYAVWAESIDDGRVVAATASRADGTYRLAGLPFGKFHIYSQSIADTDSPAVDIGEIGIISSRPTATLNKRIERASNDIRFDFLGFNGQLAGIAVMLNTGSSYYLLAGASETGGEAAKVESTSEFISIQSRSTSSVYSKDIRTFGFQAEVATDAPLGEYSVSIRNASGQRRFLIGGLSVEKFPNLWSLPVLN